jgi:hypothetical protein
MADKLARFDFAALVAAIRQVDGNLAAQAGRAVNISLTLRNWLIGAYIAEYELCGAERATYGESLLTELAKHLADHKISNCNRRQLYRYLRFYRLYPEIVGTLSAQLKELLPAGLPGSQTASHAVEKVGTASPQLQIPPDQLIHRLGKERGQIILDFNLFVAKTKGAASGHLIRPLDFIGVP